MSLDEHLSQKLCPSAHWRMGGSMMLKQQTHSRRERTSDVDSALRAWSTGSPASGAPLLLRFFFFPEAEEEEVHGG